MKPVLDEYFNNYPETHFYLRGDSGFARPDLFKQCETNGVSYAIRLKLIKIASKVIRSGRYLIFKLCSTCPYKKEFFETFENIRKMPQLE